MRGTANGLRQGVRAENTLWAITSYYTYDDPAGEKRRLKAYREFRRQLRIPLVTIELSYADTFDLTAGDADILIQVRGGAVLWQKERFLNLALRSLPGHCDTVAWTDCDVVLTRDDWP
ncbi:MAG: hypothetical protein GY953_51295, partial [bacterium]|nr:hypothetical protein [bacterium]